MKYVNRIFMGALYFIITLVMIDFADINFAVCMCGAFVGILLARIIELSKP